MEKDFDFDIVVTCADPFKFSSAAHALRRMMGATTMDEWLLLEAMPYDLLVGLYNRQVYGVTVLCTVFDGESWAAYEGENENFYWGSEEEEYKVSTDVSVSVFDPNYEMPKPRSWWSRLWA